MSTPPPPHAEPPDVSPPAPGTDPQPRMCYRHLDRSTYVSCVRCERPICAECMRPASVGFQCPDDAAAGSAQQRPLRTRFGGRQTSGRPYATYVLIALNVLAFIAQGFPVSANAQLNRFSIDFSSYNASIALNHEYYRLLTGSFLHVAIWHIAVNMFVLILVGPAVEAMLGRIRYLALYLLAGIGGSVLAYLVKDLSYVSVGASGSIFGLFAAYWVLARRVRADTSAMTGTIVLNLVISVTFPGISLYGHLGGLLVGALVGGVYAYASGPRRNAIQLAGVVAVAVLLVVTTLVRTAAQT